VKIKTSELKGAALDWAVAKCEGWGVMKLEKNFLFGTSGDAENFSTDWSLAGPIIEREKIALNPHEIDDDCWFAKDPNPKTYCEEGQTPLIAAMRCYVASKMGDEIEIPNELK
jgi:hypothetical protein